MLRKSSCWGWVSLVLIFLLLATLKVATGAPALKAITIGTSSVGSTFYTIAVGMADLLTRSGVVNATAEAVGGSDANARAIRDGKIEMAVLNSFSARDALLGKGTFVKGGPAPLRLVFQGHTSLRQLIARPQSGIHSFADLKGKVLVGKRRSLQELELITKALLKAYGMTEKDLRIVETSDTKGAIQALEVGSVDAAIFPGGVYDPNVTELMERKTAVLVPIDDQHFAKALEQLGPAFGKFTIPQNMYRNMSAPVNAFRLKAILVAGEAVPAETVYQVGKVLIDRHADLSRVHKAAAEWTIDNTLESPPIPFHAGMVRLLKEKKLWNASLQATQDKLEKEAARK
jgi:uncharacterized protein